VNLPQILQSAIYFMIKTFCSCPKPELACMVILNHPPRPCTKCPQILRSVSALTILLYEPVSCEIFFKSCERKKNNVSKKLHTEPVLVNFEGAQQSIPSLAESIPAPIFLGDLRCFGQTPLGYPRIFLFLDDFVNTPGKVANPRLALGISKDHRVNQSCESTRQTFSSISGPRFS